MLAQRGIAREFLKVPTQPPLEGLPLWAQIIISLAIGLATLGVAFKGYFNKDKPDVAPGDKQTAAILAASIVDMGAIRNLSDTVIRLDASVQRLIDTMTDAAHYERNNNEINRELCARLRALAEIMERHLK